MTIPAFTLNALLERKEQEMKNLCQMKGNLDVHSKIAQKDKLSDDASPCNEIEFTRNTVDKLKYSTNDYILELERKVVLLLARVNAEGTEIENLKSQQRNLKEELANKQMLVDELKICLNSCSREAQNYQLQLSYLKGQVTHDEEIKDLFALIEEYKTNHHNLHQELEHLKAQAQKRNNDLILTRSAQFKAEELAKNLKAKLKYSSLHKEDGTKATSKCKTPVTKIPSLTEENSLTEHSNKKNYHKFCTLEERNRIKDSEISRLKKLVSHIRMERDKNYEEKELFKEINRELFSYNSTLGRADINRSPSRGRNIPRPRNVLKVELQRHRSNPRDYTAIV